jgi:hypothetical protein
VSTKLHHWRFKEAANTVSMDLCTSTKIMRQVFDSIVFKSYSTIEVDCPACIAIVRTEMPELI